MILAELKKILIKAQWLTQDESGDMMRYDFSMELDAAIGETLPAFNLKVQNAKLRRQEVSIFNKLSNRAQMACKRWHLEAECRHATTMKELVQYAKDSGCVEQIWEKTCPPY